ncbi:MAG: NUDIX hydrolase [Anaerolineaceae bacterium]|jgi:ADP-ribose pyrophosphatase
MTHTINHESKAFSTRLFTVKRINLQFPDGEARDYDLIEIQNAVTILPIDDAGNVYFVNQYRIGAKKVLLELPAGKIEDAEDPLLTAQRELREEIGMAARTWTRLGGFYMTPGYATEYMHCFLAQGLVPDALTPDVDEFIHLTRLPLKEAIQMINDQVIEDSKTLAVMMLAQQFLH